MEPFERVRHVIQAAKDAAKGSRHLQPLYEQLLGFALTGMNFGRGGLIDHSGELDLLGRLANRHAKLSPGRPFVLFDVGANAGEYTLHAIEAFGGNVQSYAFEPGSYAFGELVKATARHRGVTPVQAGVGENEASLTLFSEGAGSKVASTILSTVMDYGHGADLRETIPIRTLDAFCEERGIEQIDLLKVDIEGGEYAALVGARSLIESGRVAAVQFEFGPCHIHARTPFRLFYDMLVPRYRLSRIVRNGLVQLDGYNARLEIFLTINYFAELKSLPPLRGFKSTPGARA
jgi:FkbM family methyltransferase